MGGICSRSSNAEISFSKVENGHEKTAMAPPAVIGIEEARKSTAERGGDEARRGVRATEPEDFYDGIPRYPKTFSLKSRSVRSTQAAVAKLGKAGKGGLGKAVEVLDTLGSSMTNFNSGNGFAAGGHAKGNEIGILSFEIANTIVKGSNLMQSLSAGSLRQLREDVLPSEAVRHLISEDTTELMRIVAADKREDLKIFSGEVIRFGNRCKDPQWHNLDRYFEKISKGVGPQKDLEEEADLVIQQLMTLVQYTAELYHELHALDRFEQDFNRRRNEAEASTVSQKEKGDSMSMLRSELKSQKKLVKHLKKKSLWSKSLEEVMEKLVDIVHFIHLVIQKEFGVSDDDHHNPAEESSTTSSKLGPAGLSLHYANMIIQIDTLVARSSNMPLNTRETLYQSLPPFLKSSLRSKLKSFRVKEEMSIKEIKDEMEKTLGWLVPVATNTAKAHHGFGWVGEWANTGADGSRKTTVQAEIMRIETLHHADKERTESHVQDMLLWLNHLAAQSKPLSIDPFPSIAKSNPAAKSKALLLSPEDRALLNEVAKKKKRVIYGTSKSRDFDTEEDKKNTKNKNERRSSGRSRSYSPPRESREVLSQPLRRVSSGPRMPGFGLDKKRVLDNIDRVDETPR